MPLAFEQFKSLRSKGLSIDQISRFARGEKPAVSRGTAGRQIEDIPEQEFTPPNLFAETARGTARSIGRSFKEDIVAPAQTMIRNPGETALGLGNLARGVFQMTPQGGALKYLPGGDVAQQTVSQVGENYRQAYGSPSRIAETVAEHPFRFLSDVSLVAGGTGAVMRGVGTPALARAGSFPMTTAAVKAGGQAVGKAAVSVAKAPITAAKFGAERTIGSMIKPLLKDFSYGKNPMAVAYERIQANNWDDWIKKLGRRQAEIGRPIADKISKSSVPIDAEKSLDNVFRPAIQKAVANNNEALVKRLSETYKAITEELVPKKIKGGNIGIRSVGRRKLNQMTPSEAWELKKRIGELAKWTDDTSTDELVNAAIQNSYRVLKHKLEVAVPGIKQLNERYANVTSAKVASIYRDKILKRHDILGPMPTKLLAGVEIIASGGDAASWLNGIAIIGVGKLMASPFAKTRLAAALAKLSEVEKIKIFKVYPQMRALTTKLKSEKGEASFFADGEEVSLINFKSTESAVKYGESIKSDPAKVAKLESLFNKMDEAANLMDKDSPGYFTLVQKRGIVRESLNRAKGTESTVHKRLSDESLARGEKNILQSALTKKEKQEKLMDYYLKLRAKNEKAGNVRMVRTINERIQKISFSPEEEAAIYRYHADKD